MRLEILLGGFSTHLKVINIQIISKISNILANFQPQMFTFFPTFFSYSSVGICKKVSGMPSLTASGHIAVTKAFDNSILYIFSLTLLYFIFSFELSFETSKFNLTLSSQHFSLVLKFPSNSLFSSRPHRINKSFINIWIIHSIMKRNNNKEKLRYTQTQRMLCT